LSKLLGRKPKYSEQNVLKTDESIGVSQLLGACARAASSKAYAYDNINNNISNYNYNKIVNRNSNNSKY